MKNPLAVLAAVLLCASSALSGAARAQHPAQPPAQLAAQQPADARAARPPPVYRVELVVFRATSALGAPEDWAAEAGTAPVTSTDADPGSADPSGGVPASSAQASSSAVGVVQAGAGSAPAGTAPSSGAAQNGVTRILPASEFELEGLASRLRVSGRYIPVAHIAWAQTASPWGKPLQIPLASVGLAAPGITGTAALERGVFLHLALDLRYVMSDPPAGLDAPPGTAFVLDESHRVRLKERNYFDHPAFGVIALITSDQAPPARAGR